MRFLAWLVVLAVALGMSADGSPVHAQDAGTCEPPEGQGPVEVTPASGGRQVTLDAYVRVTFTSGYLQGLDPAELFSLHEDVEGPPLSGPEVAGRAQIVGDFLFFVPDAPLRADTVYEGLALGFDFDLEFNFTTGDAMDRRAPSLGRIDNVSSSRVDASCDAPTGGYRVDVSFAPATDDGSPGSIEYFLYLTRGPGLNEPELRASARNFSTSDVGTIPMAFVLRPAEAVAPVCVVVHAVDGVGNVDDDMPARCFEPITGNFFEPLCAAPGAVTAGRGFGGAWALLAAALVLVRRRRRR